MSEQLDQGQVAESGAVGGDTPIAQPELTVQTLNNIRALIDIACQRGAYRAAEMAAVGVEFNKLNNFLNAVAPQPAADAPSA